MDEANQILDFFSSFRNMAMDPECYQANEVNLDRKFEALLDNTFRPVHTEDSGHLLGSSITFVKFNLSGTESPHLNNHRPRLNVCTPQHDELLHGWVSRMQAINCLTILDDLKTLISEMSKSLKPHIDQSDFLECVAAVIGFNKDELIRKHTLTHFFNALIGLKPSKPGSKSVRHRKTYEKNSHLKLGGSHLRYCSECASKDLANLGYSYWRRSHQLPGILWCHQHALPLYTHSSTSTLESPHTLINSALVNGTDSLSLQQVKILKNYSRIAYSILENEHKIESVAASISLGKLAHKLDLRISKSGKKPTPSTLLIESLPEWWLSEAYPRASLKPNSYVCVIDGACSPKTTRYTTTTLCLLASLFYEDSNEALKELQHPSATGPRKPKGFNFWGSKETLNHYIEEKGIVSRIAAKLSLPTSTVAIGLLNQGLPGLGKSSPEINAANAFLNGMSLQESCFEHKASSKDTEELLRAFCTKIRPALNIIAASATEKNSRLNKSS